MCENKTTTRYKAKGNNLVHKVGKQDMFLCEKYAENVGYVFVREGESFCPQVK